MPSNIPIVEVDAVSKRFIMHKDKSVKERLVNFSRSRRYREDFWALQDVSLTIDCGETVGLVGHNGSGKSTLLKALGGIIQPSSGAVRRRGRLAALLELGAGFHPDLTGRENVYLNAAILGLSRAETDLHFDAIVDFSGIEEFIDTQVKFYSSGMYVRLAFAVAVHVDPDLLLVDEVLAVGDEPFQRKCMDKIAEFQREGRTIVLVSHSADQVASLCDRVAVLDHGRLVHDGDTADGLRVLRAGFADAAEREAERRGQSVPDLSGEARITQVTARPSQLTPNGLFVAGSDVTIDIDYEAVHLPEGWIAGIDIENPMGQPIYRLNSEGMGLELPRDPGARRFSVQLPHFNLGGGQYLVTASLVRRDGSDIDRRSRVTSFFMEDDARGVGVAQFPASAAVIDLP